MVKGKSGVVIHFPQVNYIYIYVLNIICKEFQCFHNNKELIVLTRTLD